MRGEFEKNAQGSKEESVEKREPSEKFKAAEAAIICLDVSMQGALGISASERDLVFWVGVHISSGFIDESSRRSVTQGPLAA